MPGRPMHAHAAQPAVHHRLARPHRDPPERHGDAFSLQRLLDEVVVADRGAAGGDQDIGAAVAGPADSFRGGGDRVGGNPEIDGLGALGPRQRPQRIAVGIDDLPGAGDRARHHKFVAGGEHRDLRAAPHSQLRIVHAGGEREVAVGEAVSRRKQHIALAEVDAGGADVPSRNGGVRDGDVIAIDAGVFLDDDGVGSVGDHAAGKDPHGLVWRRLSCRTGGRLRPRRSPSARAESAAASAARTA